MEGNTVRTSLTALIALMLAACGTEPTPEDPGPAKPDDIVLGLPCETLSVDTAPDSDRSELFDGTGGTYRLASAEIQERWTGPDAETDLHWKAGPADPEASTPLAPEVQCAQIRSGHELTKTGWEPYLLYARATLRIPTLLAREDGVVRNEAVAAVRVLLGGSRDMQVARRAPRFERFLDFTPEDLNRFRSDGRVFEFSLHHGSGDRFEIHVFEDGPAPLKDGFTRSRRIILTYELL